jgi:hypothetical protein
MFPDCVIVKNDAGYLQGVPDLLILFGKKWAALEVKRAVNASRRPNQDYFVEKLNKMSFAAFVHPGNVEEVLRDLQTALRPSRKARVSEPK